MLIRSDLGVPMSLRIVEALRERATTQTITAQDVVEVAREEILRVLPIQPAPIRLPAKPQSDPDRRSEWHRQDDLHRETRLLFPTQPPQRAAGSRRYLPRRRDRTVSGLGGAPEDRDDQGQYNADPAALCYEAYQSADRRDIEFLICDTAGRLHTKSNLMAELEKIKRSLAKHDPHAPHERLLVVDATTGSNALSQAREFHAASISPALSSPNSMAAAKAES